jgi:hypothetical protein
MKHSNTSAVAVAIVMCAFLAGQAAADLQAQTKPTLTAKLIDPEKKAAEGAATVEVTTSGVELVDPALSNEKPVSGQGHLHYQLDKGPVIATPSAKLSFHELPAGSHTITVILAGNDHKPLGPQQQLTVKVTKGPVSTSGAPSKSGY